MYLDTSNKLLDIVKDQNLNTVCAEANCPNIYECWNRGTATLMILGDICTRACGFCAVKTGKPTWDDPLEPMRTALAVKKMQLKHVVITSVDRDDLKGDYGASIWAQTINEIHKKVPECTVEVLTPDFRGDHTALEKVFIAEPEIFSHNLECVERISKAVRTQSNWQRSLNVLKASANYGLKTKTGLMVGLGETLEDIQKLLIEGIDYLYLPSDNSLDIFNQSYRIQIGKKKLSLCDKYRPGHFDGVVTIVNKLFTIVEPQRAFFGLKDYQQFLHVKNLSIINDLNIDIIPCETIRSNDGLAMSSRNNLLSKKGLQLASNIYKSIKRVKDSILVNQNILNEEIDYLSKLGIEIEYYQICDQETLEPINHKINNKFIVAIAAYVEGIRLIDNILSDQ